MLTHPSSLDLLEGLLKMSHYEPSHLDLQCKGYQLGKEFTIDKQGSMGVVVVVVRFRQFKGSPISKNLACIKIYQYKQNLQFCQGDRYFWLYCNRNSSPNSKNQDSDV